MVGLVAVSLLAAAPPQKLGPVEVAHFKRQLEPVVGKVLEQLSAKKVRCAISPERAEWVSEETTTNADGSLAPQQWFAVLKCSVEGKAPFRMAVNLSSTPFPVPKKDIVARGEGFVIRWIGPEQQTLVIGPYTEFGPDDGFAVVAPKDDPPPLAPPIAVLVSAETGPGQPDPLDVLKRVDVRATAALLGEVARGAAPKTALKPVDLRPQRGAPVPEPIAYPASNEPEPRPLAIATPPLTRVLSADDEAYFATVLARAVPALFEALGGRKRCWYEPRREGSEPEARGGPDGYRPASWELLVQCDVPDGGPSALYVDLRRRRERQAGEVTQKALAPDAVLRTYTLDELKTTVLSVGDQAVENERERRPGLTRLGTIELTAYGAIDRAELERIEVAPLRAVLKAPPAPPATAAVATEGPPTKTARDELEAAVYRAMLDDIARGRAIERMVLEAELQGPRPPALDALRSVAPELSASAISDFAKVATKGGPVPASSTFSAPIVRLTADEKTKIFGTRDGWKKFREQFPGAAGIVSLSRVGLSRDGSQAVAYVGQQSDWLAGHGELAFLRRDPSGAWRIIYRLPLWIS